MEETIIVPYIAGHASGLVVSQWRVAVGDPVRAGEVLLELDAESAIIEITALADGTLLACHVAEGELVDAGHVVGTLGIADARTPAAMPPAPAIPSTTTATTAMTTTATASAGPVWEVRVFEVGLGAAAVALDVGWEPFAVLGPRQVVARRVRGGSTRG